jgi:glycine cleavage system H lipoate-binding protein
MPCPFLKEGRALYCHAAPMRTLILKGPGVSGAGRCESPDYDRCDFATKDEKRRDRCPHLEEIHVQYCEATSPKRLIPFSESQSSSCTTGGYRYCESYLSLARPHRAVEPPASLLYTPNHFWLTAEESGLSHIGVDMFLIKVVGKVDGVTFVTTHGTERPVVVLTINGTEWPMTFPNPMLIEKVNAQLRRDPSRLSADPYGSGWLFAGWEIPRRTRAGLIHGPHAMAWQTEERERLAREVHDKFEMNCDGGRAVEGIVRLMPRARRLCLLQRFFSASEWSDSQ